MDTMLQPSILGPSSGVHHLADMEYLLIIFLFCPCDANSYLSLMNQCLLYLIQGLNTQPLDDSNTFLNQLLHPLCHCPEGYQWCVFVFLKSKFGKNKHWWRKKKKKKLFWLLFLASAEKKEGLSFVRASLVFLQLKNIPILFSEVVGWSHFIIFCIFLSSFLLLLMFR